MIEHLLNHPVALAHVVTALFALGFGTIVLLRRKGDRRHRWMGRGYVITMLVMNITALLDYELYGRFGPFHWFALISLASVISGQVAVRRKRPGWKYPHANLMVGSNVGLVAAAVAEIASRVPGWRFGLAVTVSSFVVILIGIWLMLRLVPGSVGKIANKH